MSLRVWLPLTKDLRNQGLDEVTVTNNGATFNSAGKLGGCYSFGTGNSYITVDSTPLKTFTEFSFACWVKIISWNTSYSTIFAAKDSTSVGWANLIFSLLRYGANSTLCFSISNGSNSTSTNCQTGTLSLNTWYHITCTYKSGQIKLYQDGNVVSTYNTNIVPNFSSIANLWIGKSNESSYQSNNLLNDIRIYDHCLSPMEVKELSKGLVLHYPLNRGGWGQENLLLNSNDLTLWPIEGNGKIELQEDGYFKVSSKASNTTRYGIYYDFTFPEPNTYTFSVDVKDDWLIGVAPASTFAWTASNLSGTQGKKRISYTCTSTEENNKCRIYIAGNGTGGRVTYLKQPKFEKGSIATPWCPNSSDALAATMGLNGTTEYDTSGYCNNGVRTGTFSWTSDTPKYSISTKFNGAEKISANSLPLEVQSVSFWVKVSTIPSGYGICYVDSNTQTSIGFYNGNSFITSCAVSANVVLLGTTFKANEWNHIVLVKTGANTRNVYCNGILLTNSGTNSWVHNGSNLSLGWRDYASGNAGWFNGQLCDFRAYATALSADDVKSLYQNSAYIDSSGNVYGTIHES